MSNNSGVYPVPVEYIVARYFVKYRNLSSLISYAFSNSKATTVNLYIDLYGIYKTIFSRSYRTDISDYTSFTVTLINMCAHYRSFFKGIGVHTNIWIISSYNTPEISKKFVAEYNKTFDEKLKIKDTREMVELNVQLLETICPYLPDIYFLKTEFESTILINHIIKLELSKGNNNPNIILSSDIFPLQLCSEFENTVLLKPVKFKSEDMSIITIPKDSNDANSAFWWMICQQRDLLMSDVSTITISPRNLVILETLNRFPERNLPNIISITEANKLIYSVVGNASTKLNVQMLYDALPDLYSKLPKEKLESRYKVLDLDYQYYLFNESIEPKLLHYENLSDPGALDMINANYFQNNPIDLLRL